MRVTHHRRGISPLWLRWTTGIHIARTHGRTMPFGCCSENLQGRGLSTCQHVYLLFTLCQSNLPWKQHVEWLNSKLCNHFSSTQHHNWSANIVELRPQTSQNLASPKNSQDTSIFRLRRIIKAPEWKPELRNWTSWHTCHDVFPGHILAGYFWTIHILLHHLAQNCKQKHRTSGKGTAHP